ncbi:AAA-ATPase [Clostridium sporogenes]|uniref:ATP-dependent nuclease n=1 Tax=Clostridium botulinum TaxID=1491 RepID=UPI000717A4BC|nr:AAA family ATPase [Clostridium botulinum]KRU26547.1 AAA-ATPase [Clostridium sporogenes]KRU28142.1 AAA-ATPase [Clostridium sporogenes]KRU29058.1 AAA-ATPase [Clostridium sporogenes]KRU39847.1 AAA-ATPase [Clostridium sporogenes]MBZ1329548.1 AAA family ATPase [Clostridium botulinum]
MVKKNEKTINLVSDNPKVEKPRLHKLIIKNFRCIGSKPVEIELDDIVVLVGSNNVGKSSILRAYEVVMSNGSKGDELKLEDFPNGKIDEKLLPEIELQTIVYDNTPGIKWITETKDGENLVRERWIWKKEGKPTRQGYDVGLRDWSDKVPWGAPNVANSRRPQPHRIDAFSSPETQSKEIKKILLSILHERINNLEEEYKNGEINDYAKLLSMIKEIQSKIVSDSEKEIEKIQDELTNYFSEIFPKYKIIFDAKPEEDVDKSINLFKADSQLLVGPQDGYLSDIEKQGSGARRTLLWTALKIVAETKSKEKSIERPHLLLLDEPELCLHPTAIRDASKLLYDLPKEKNWQVMITTHSPLFIDVSRDNTTIIRVEKNNLGNIQGTTLFRPNKVKLDEDDKQNLKLLNIFDPYVAEFFFGGKTIIVEGDTEYTAFKYVISKNQNKYKNIHIIRARGKATIVSLIKILNHFGSDYSVLHDSDHPVGKKGGKNPAWTNNKKILDTIKQKDSSSKVRLLASICNFEMAYLGDEVTREKPYNALTQIRNDAEKFNPVERLLDVLVDHSNKDIPENCAEWDNINELEKLVLQKAKQEVAVAKEEDIDEK